MSGATRGGMMVLLAAILLAPVWIVEFPPLGDYPNHLASSFVLAHLHDPRFTFANIYEAHWAPFPYVAMDVMLVGLQRIVPVELAGRVFLSLCLLALPAAVWFFLRRANPGHEHLAFWSLLLSYSIFFMNGYLAYYLSIAVGCIALGLWLGYLVRPSGWRWVGVVTAFTALYFTHAIGFAVASVIVAIHALWKRQSFKQWALLLLVFLPAAVFYLTSRTSGVLEGQSMTFQSVHAKAGWFLGVLRHSSRLLDLVTFLVIGAGVGIAWWHNAEFQVNREWVIVAGGLLVLYWLLPIGYGFAWDVDIRVLPFLYIVVLAGARVGHRSRWLAAAAVALFLLQAGGVVHDFIAEQPHLVGLAESFGRIPRHARVLPLIEIDPHAHNHPYVHFWAYGMIRRGWLAPSLFAIPGALPLRVWSGSYIPTNVGEPRNERIDWRLIRDTYDYVWAYNVRRLWRELDQIGERVFTTGNLDVYRIARP